MALVCSFFPSRYFCTDENIFMLGRAVIIEMISAPVETLYLLRFLRLRPCHETHHFAPGHLGVNTLLNDLAVFQISKNAGDVMIVRLQIFLDAFGILLRSMIDNNPAVVKYLPISVLLTKESVSTRIFFAGEIIILIPTLPAFVPDYQRP